MFQDNNKQALVIPAKAGTQSGVVLCSPWVPAFAGMTVLFSGRSAL